MLRKLRVCGRCRARSIFFLHFRDFLHQKFVLRSTCTNQRSRPEGDDTARLTDLSHAKTQQQNTTVYTKEQGGKTDMKKGNVYTNADVFFRQLPTRNTGHTTTPERYLTEKRAVRYLPLLSKVCKSVSAYPWCAPLENESMWE